VGNREKKKGDEKKGRGWARDRRGGEG